MKHSIAILFFLLCVSFNISAQLVLNTTDGLPDLGRSCSVWADFNNDGLLDVALSGINAAGTKQAGVFINNNNGSFSNSGIGLTAVSDGDMAVNDYNQDGKIDLLVTGVDASQTKVTQLYKNEGHSVFSMAATSFEGVGYGGCSFTDLNNDGKPDVLINGLTNQNQSVTLLYRSNANGTFTLQASPLGGTSYGDVLVFDVNNDSFSDVLISGLNGNNQRVMELYVNKGSFTWVKTPTILPPLRSGSMASADVNNDSYADLFITGNSSGSTNHTAVYLNNAGAGFTWLQSFPGVSEGTGTWGDYNNDGWADLAFFGFDKTDLVAFVFDNVAGTSFVDSTIPLPGASQGSIHWVDYNKDNRLDLLFSGYASVPFTSVYTHDASTVNTLPSVPVNLKSTSYADSIVLSWDAASDLETAANGLTYTVYIGSSSGATDVLNPLSNLATGWRKVKGNGSVEHTYLVIPNLSQGTYYWGVQTMDAAYGASAFSAEAITVSCAPVFISGEDQVCFNASLDLKAGEHTDEVTWYSKIKNNLVLGTGLELHAVLTTKDTIVAKIVKPLGCTLYDTLVVDVLPLPVVDAGEDKKSCIGKEVTLHAASGIATIQWFEAGQEANILFTGSTIHTIAERQQSLVARVEDNKGCRGTDTVSIGLYPQPVVDLGADQIVCTGSTLSWSAGTPADSVNWYNTQGLLSRNEIHFSLPIQHEDQVWVEVFNAERCVSYDTLHLSVYALPIAHAGEDQLICGQQDAARVGDPAQDPSGLSFSWEPGLSLNAADVPSPMASPATDTKYIVRVKDQHACENTDTVWVYINPVTLLQAGADRPVCTGSSTLLGGTPTASGSSLAYTFQWSPAEGLNDATSPNPVASPIQNTTYVLQVTAGNCAAGSAQVTVTVNPLPVVRANEDLTVGAEQSASLSVEGANTYEWFPEELFSDATSAQPVVYPNRSTVYRVQGKDVNGCLNSDTVVVTVRSELFIPGLFTPNDDAVNPVFRAHGFGVRTITLKVFDRWGRLLFASDDLQEAWDGQFNGQPVESGNYIWTVEGEFFDGGALHCQGQKRGIIKLLR